ncbi:MAG: carboxypeptidase-like regulatory domain-containing protein, partial [Flavitalea sp.]
MKQLLMIAVLFFSAWTVTGQELMRKLSGTVKTEKGETLSGVSIQLKDPATKKILFSQTTGENGVYNFSGLDADKNYELSFSYIGYEEIILRNVDASTSSNPLNIQLKEKGDA